MRMRMRMRNENGNKNENDIENENENEKWWIMINVKDQYLHWLVKNKCTGKSIMFGCISLNPVFLLNNECKKINIYIDTLKSAQEKVLCLLVLIE